MLPISTDRRLNRRLYVLNFITLFSCYVLIYKIFQLHRFGFIDVEAVAQEYLSSGLFMYSVFRSMIELGTEERRELDIEQRGILKFGVILCCILSVWRNVNTCAGSYSESACTHLICLTLVGIVLTGARYYRTGEW